MRLFKILAVIIVLSLSMVFTSCSGGNTGDLKINVKLPMFTAGGCDSLNPKDTWIAEDYTYDQCFVPGDKITISVYRKAFPADNYLYVQQEVIDVTIDNMWGGKASYIRTLTSGSYYKFFVVVTNKNQKMKMAGGVEGVVYDSATNKDISIFLSNVADFARVTTNGKDDGSVTTYAESFGTKGASATALEDGRIFMTGGYNIDVGAVVGSTNLFNPATLSMNKAAPLPAPLWDHGMATLRDGSESGKAIIAFGKALSGYSGAIYSYDAETDKYRSLQNISGRTGTRVIKSADGSVYIFGGCDASQAFKDVFKVDATTGQILSYKTLHTARCYHSVADLSYEDETGFHPRFLIMGGLNKDSYTNVGDYIAGEAFAELLTDAGSVPIKLNATADFDIPERLAFQASAGITWLVSAASDTKAEERAYAASVVGGVVFTAETNTTITSPAFYSIFKAGDDWMISRNASPLSCAYPTMAQVPSIYEAQLAAVNCGPALVSPEELPERDVIGIPQFFVLQLNRTTHNGMPAVSAAARISINGADFTDEYNPQYTYIDGPTVVNNTGQAYLLGNHYIYKVSGYTVK